MIDAVLEQQIAAADHRSRSKTREQRRGEQHAKRNFEVEAQTGGGKIASVRYRED